MSFDAELLIPNLTEKEFNKMNIDQSFKAFKRDDLKLVYKVKFDNQKKHERKRVVTKSWMRITSWLFNDKTITNRLYKRK